MIKHYKPELHQRLVYKYTIARRRGE